MIVDIGDGMRLDRGSIPLISIDIGQESLIYQQFSNYRDPKRTLKLKKPRTKLVTWLFLCLISSPQALSGSILARNPAEIRTVRFEEVVFDEISVLISVVISS